MIDPAISTIQRHHVLAGRRRVKQYTKLNCFQEPVSWNKPRWAHHIAKSLLASYYTSWVQELDFQYKLCNPNETVALIVIYVFTYIRL